MAVAAPGSPGHNGTTGSAEVTMDDSASLRIEDCRDGEATASYGCRARQTLDLVADKWSLLVIASLAAHEKRFTELKREIDGISQRMLTVTLRGLEREGVLTRIVHQVMPPHVSYELTPLGITLSAAVRPLIDWTDENLDLVDKARVEYDTRP